MTPRLIAKRTTLAGAVIPDSKLARHGKKIIEMRTLINPLTTLALGLVAAIVWTQPRVHAATLYWDANGATAGQTDGAGAWLTANQWWTGSANTSWTSGDDAVFGYSGAGGAVTIGSATTVNSITANPFTGTYTLGTAGQAVTLNNGITKNSGAGILTIVSPLTLAGAQTWTNNSNANINLQATTTLSGNLTFAGSANFDFTNANGVIAGSGDLIMNGSGQLNLSAGGFSPTHTFTGNIIVNDGSVGFQTASVLSGRNVNLTNGYLGGRFGSGFTWSSGLGTGSNQIQITDGTSGISGEGNTSSDFRIGSALSVLKWGAAGENGATGYFNPDVFLANGNVRMNAFGKGSLNNGIDLNGTTRTITSLQTTDGAATSGFTIRGAISNSTGTAGLTKTGTGNLILTAANTYSGATTISSAALNTATQGGGAITLSGASGTINSTSALNLSGVGTLRLVNTAQVNRFADSAAITSNGGFILYENTSGANVYTETMGSITLSGGQLNIVELTNQAGAGSQTLTFGGLTQSGTGAVTFSANTTGPQIAGNKNMIVVTGAGTTTAGQIIGPWATTGTAANAQTDYAVYSGNYVTAANLAANNVETTWASTDNINFNAATTLTGTRTVNTLRYSGAADTLALGSNNLETTGLLNGGSGVLTITGTGALTTPSGGGNLYVTTGSSGITNGAPITNNAGTVNLVKSGTGGTLILNGLNTYTGTTTINAGTLQLGTNGTANGANLNGGSYAGDIFIAGGATLDIQTNASQTLSGVISGDGNIVKRYSGTLTLSGSNTYTGTTSITPLTTAGGGTIVVSSLNSVVGGSASSSLGAPTTVANGTIGLGSTTVQTGVTLQYVGSGETTDRVIDFRMNGTGATKTIDTSGLGTLRFTSTPTASGSTTNDITLQGSNNGQFDGGLPFVFRNFTKTGTGTWTLGGVVGSTGSFSISNGTLIATDPRALGAAIGNLATSGPTIAGAGTLSLRNDSSVTFGVANTGYNINNSASGATINVDRVTGTGSNTLTVGNLTTTSTAATWQLNFTGANGVSLNAGTLTTPTTASVTTHTISNTIAGGGGLTLAGITGGGTTTGTLAFTGNGNTTVTGAITQAGTSQALTKSGTGTLTLSGSSSYTGTTTINASGGTLQLGDGGTGGSLNTASAISVGTGATFAVNQSDTVTQGTDFSGAAITGAGGFTQAGSGTTVLTAANTYSGPTAVNAGTLQLNGGASIATSSLTTVAGGATLTGTGTTGPLTISAGGFHNPGLAGVGAQTASGNYTLDGTLQIQFASNGGVAGTDHDLVDVTGGGTVLINALTGALSTPYTGIAGTFNPAFGQVFTIIQNDLADPVTGNFAGLPAGSTVTVDGDPLKIYYDQGSGNDVVLVSALVSATPIDLYVDGTFATPSTVDGDRQMLGTQSAFVDTNAFASPAAALAAYPATDANVLVNGGTYASAFLAGGGDVTLRLVEDLVGGQPDVTLQDLSGDATDAIVTQYEGGPNGNLIVEQGSFAGAISGTGSLTKTTGGTLTLSGNSTYTGPTNVNAGTLLVNGSTAAGSSVTVGGAGTLGGTGTVGGNTDILGTHNPGDSGAGIQTFNSDLSYSGGASVVNWELFDDTSTNMANPSALFDTVLVGGNLDFTDPTTLNLIFNDALSMVDWTDLFWQSDHLGTGGWLLFDVAGMTTGFFGNLTLAPLNWLDGNGGDFATLLAGAGFSLVQIGNDIYLNYTAPVAEVVPEPGTLIIAALGLLGMLGLARRRRR